MRPRLCKLEVEMDRVREGGKGKTQEDAFSPNLIHKLIV